MLCVISEILWMSHYQLGQTSTWVRHCKKDIHILRRFLRKFNVICPFDSVQTAVTLFLRFFYNSLDCVFVFNWEFSHFQSTDYHQLQVSLLHFVCNWTNICLPVRHTSRLRDLTWLSEFTTQTSKIHIWSEPAWTLLSFVYTSPCQDYLLYTAAELLRLHHHLSGPPLVTLHLHLDVALLPRRRYIHHRSRQNFHMDIANMITSFWSTTRRPPKKHKPGCWSQRPDQPNEVG